MAADYLSSMDRLRCGPVGRRPFGQTLPLRGEGLGEVSDYLAKGIQPCSSVIKSGSSPPVLQRSCFDCCAGIYTKDHTTQQLRVQ
jgi:hypothetical protein